MHEVGYTVVALGDGRFRFGSPSGRQLGRTGRIAAPATAVTGSGPGEAVTRPYPAWAGERLDLRLLIDAMVANTVLASGHRPPDVPVSEIPRIVREAVGWPMSGAA